MNAGIYHVTFTSSLPDGGEGLAVFKEGKINGGDIGYLYLGTYVVSGTQVTAKLKVQRWNSSVVSIFGNAQEFELELTGTFSTDFKTFTTRGAPIQMPNYTITVGGRRLADAI